MNPLTNWALNNWRFNKYAKTINGKLGIDTDGSYGFQCKDFINAYFDTFTNWIPAGNANNLAVCPLPPTVERIVYRSGVQLLPGDAFLENRGKYGHTGIVVSVSPNGWTSIDQNWFGANDTVGSPPATVIHTFSLLTHILRIIPGKGAGEDMSVVDLDMVRKMAQTVGGRINRSGRPDNNGQDLKGHVGTETNKEFLNWYSSKEATDFRDVWLPAVLNVYDRYNVAGPQLEQAVKDREAAIKNLEAEKRELNEKIKILESQGGEDTKLLNETGNVFTRLWNRLFKK